MGLGANNMGGSGLFVETVAEQLGEKYALSPLLSPLNYYLFSPYY